MQTIHQADLTRTIAVETQADSNPTKTAPIELSLAALKQVAGGVSPNSNW